MKKITNRTKFIKVVLLLWLVNSTQGNAQTSINTNQSSTGEVQTYTYPRICPQCKEYRVKANGKDIFVYQTSAGAFAAFSCSGTVEIEVESNYSLENVVISPKRYGINPVVNAGKAVFKINSSQNVVLHFENKPFLYIYANPIPRDMPDAGNPDCRYFKAGQIYEVGELRLKENQTVHIEGGAVVRGCIRATLANNIKISGHGVLDGGYYRKSVDGHRSIVLENCINALIENIIMIEPSSWMLVLGICSNTTVRNVKQLGFVSGSDGVDIVGCKSIKVENCMFRNGDDCIAIKSVNLSRHSADATLDFTQDVEDIEINSCAFIANEGGQAFEIGHELRTGSVKNIRFINCDVIGVHGQGGVFGIHNADWAVISDVFYENIRVEHYYNKLIDLRIIKSRWGNDDKRGQVRKVVFRNIDVTVSVYNPGYSISLIGGYDAKHTIENVIFENFKMNGKVIANPNEMDLYLKETKDVKFK